MSDKEINVQIVTAPEEDIELIKLCAPIAAGALGFDMSGSIRVSREENGIIVVDDYHPDSVSVVPR